MINELITKAQTIESNQFLFDKSVKEKIDNNNELLTYFVINECGGFLWRTQHDYNKGMISDEDFASMSKDRINFQKTIEYCVSKTEFFGVDFSECKKQLNESKSYWKWFRWWDSYIKSLSDDEWHKLDKKISNNENIDNCRPEGDWKNDQQMH